MFFPLGLGSTVRCIHDFSLPKTLVKTLVENLVKNMKKNIESAGRGPPHQVRIRSHNKILGNT